MDKLDEHVNSFIKADYNNPRPRGNRDGGRETERVND